MNEDMHNSLLGRILLVDADTVSRLTLSGMLEACSWQVFSCNALDEAWNELGTGTYDVVVFSSPVLDDVFFNAITALKKNSSGLKYLLLSCRPLSAQEREMFDSQIAKPIGLEALHATVNKLVVRE